MPDGVITTVLGAKYNTVYKQVCQGHFSPQQLARKVVKVLREDITGMGDTGQQLIEALTALSKQGERILLRLLSGSMVDWKQATEQSDQITRSIDSKRVRNLVLNAAKEELHTIRNAEVPSDISINLHRRFLLGLYAANFSERLPEISNHFDGATSEDVDTQIKAMQPFVEAELNNLAEQISRKGSVTRLRMLKVDKQPIPLDKVLA